VRAAFAGARSTPFLLYCWIVVIIYSVAYSSFANFGLLVRQRSLVMPAVFVLLAVRATATTKERSAFAAGRSRAIAGAVRAGR
jgi:hypothetical protein